MTTNARPKPISEDVAEQILNQTEATFGLWERQGYCPCCIARSLLASAGLLAAHEIRPEDMRDVLGYIAMQSEKLPAARRHGSALRQWRCILWHGPYQTTRSHARW